MINKDLLSLTMKHIEENVEALDQTSWASKKFNKVFSIGECGTSFCFAGHALILNDPDTKFKWLPFNDNELTAWETESGEPIEVKARKLLGLNKQQAFHLFNADNEVEDLRFLVDMLINDKDIEVWID